MEQKRFVVKREEEAFKTFADWERPAVESYLMVLEHKLNDFAVKLDAIETDFYESYRGSPEQIPLEKIESKDADRWRIAVSLALEDFYGWGSASLADFEQMLRNLSSQARSWVHRKVRDAINWLLSRVIPFFRSFAAHLHVQSWSVGGGVGFPFNIGINISVAFDPI